MSGDPGTPCHPSRLSRVSIPSPGQVNAPGDGEADHGCSCMAGCFLSFARCSPDTSALFRHIPPQVRSCHPLLERPLLAPVAVQQEHGSGVMANEHTCGSRHEKTHSPLSRMQMESLSSLHTWLCFPLFPVECPGATRSRTALLCYTLAVPMAQPRCPCTN